jgi:hypothetical protein
MDVVQIVGAACTGYLLWSGLARETLFDRPRRWLYDRFPPDGHVPANGRVPSMILFERGTAAPINLPRFNPSPNMGMWVAFDGFETPNLPSPALVQSGGEWRVLAGDQFVQVWCRIVDGNLVALPESEPLPKRYVDVTGTEPVLSSGTWIGNLVDCYRCAGFWITAGVVAVFSEWGDSRLVEQGGWTAIAVNDASSCSISSVRSTSRLTVPTSRQP